MIHRAWPLTTLVLLNPIGVAAVLDGNPSNYRALLATMTSGDTLVLSSGTYTQGLPLESRVGTSAQPIIIRGPEDQSAVFTARSCCNTVQLDGTSYVEIRNLTLDGVNLDGPFGVDARGASHHITLEGLKIVNHGADQQIVGISTKGPAWNWTIRRNTIIGAGTGIYLGNSDGSQPFVAGIIEYNVILDSVGYNLQIKHQLPRPTGVGLPQGVSRTVIRNNVFSKRNNASTGANARPNVLVGHAPLSGAGTDDLYEIYGNLFYENPTEALFQGEGNLAIYDNLFVNSSGDAVNVQPQNDRPRTVAILNNTVVASGVGIRVNGGAAGTTQRIVGNAVFAATAISGPNATENVTGSRADASAVLIAPLAAIGALNLFPKSGALVGSTIDLSAFSSFSEYDRDFNGRARLGRSRGAYEGDGANPGWTLALTIKPATVGSPPSPAPSAPTVTLSANPAQVPVQGSSTLTWTTGNVSSCTASGGWSGPRVTTGSESISALSATTSFRLECTGAGGTQAATAQVLVVAAPTVVLTASAARITSGGTVTLQWSSTNAAACFAGGSWAGSRSTSGSEVSSAVTVPATFSLTCTGIGGSANGSVAVAVDGPTPPPAAGTTPPPAPSAGATGSATGTNGGGGSTSALALLGLGIWLGRAALGRGWPARVS